MQYEVPSLTISGVLSSIRKHVSVIIPFFVVAFVFFVPEFASAQPLPGPPPANPGAGVASGSYRICEMTMRLFEMVEGNTGALIMVLGGILAVVSAAFGAYRSAVSLIVIAVGAFILRSLVDIFFNFGTCSGNFPGGNGGFPPFIP